jgi:hypothetical protein
LNDKAVAGNYIYTVKRIKLLLGGRKSFCNLILFLNDLHPAPTYKRVQHTKKYILFDEVGYLTVYPEEYFKILLMANEEQHQRLYKIIANLAKCPSS